MERQTDAAQGRTEIPDNPKGCTMPARPHPVPPEGSFIILQQRGHDRIRFEVKAGKMVSIRVEPASDPAFDPASDTAPETDNTDAASFARMNAKGNC
jgi:hypothetical protein